MSAPLKPRVLCVDDEPLVLQGLRRNLRRFEVVIADGGPAALRIMQEEAPFAVIVSDMRMPVMNGAEFLARAREQAPESVRVLLTGHADLDSALAAVNQGQIYRFLTKPCPPEVLTATLEAGAEQFRLIHSERELLGQTLTGAVKALSEILALSNPTAFGRASRVHRTVATLCARLKVPERWAIEVAAQLSQIGSIQLPAAVAEKLYFGQALTPAEQLQADRGPALADQLLANIPRLEPVREMLAAQARRYDGTDGTSPERGEAIPLGARMLKVATDLDTLEATGLSSPEAVAVLQARLGTYDPRLLEALEAEVSTRTSTSIQDLPLADVKPGMQLAEDLRSRAGVLLVARGFVVSQGLLMKLQNLSPGPKEPIRVVVAAPQVVAQEG
jgi:response regulator RpfG family c-di-GMP phosphodiesterase